MGCDKIVFSYAALLISATILNTLGLYFLFTDTNIHTKQNLILKFLGSLELAYSCVLIIRYSFTCHGYTTSDTVTQILLRMVHSIYLNITFIMVIMTFDRLIAVQYPLRYAFILKRRRARLILISSTLFWIIIGASCLALDFIQFRSIFHEYVDPAVSLVSATFMVVSYVFIFIKLLRRKRNLNSSSHSFQNRSRTENRKILKMATIITVTYLICYVVPDVANLLCHKCFANSIHIYRILWHLGPVFDPITYIFMQRRLRKRLTRLICCGKKTQRDPIAHIFMQRRLQKSLARLMGCGKKTQRNRPRIERGVSKINENRREVFDTRL